MSIFIPVLFIPFTGVVVRYRLAYHPKETPALVDPESVPATGIEQDNSTATSGESSNVVSVVAAPLPKLTLFSVWKEVRRVEGRAGLFKGLLPTIIAIFLLPFVGGGFFQKLYFSPAPITLGRSPINALLSTISYSIILIWVYRAIITPRKLEIFGTSIKGALQTLFTDRELRRPWTLFLTPGLLPALMTSILVHGVVSPMRQFIQPDKNRMPVDEVYYLRAVAVSLLALSSTLIFAPLDVIVTRLAVQRIQSSSRAEPAPQSQNESSTDPKVLPTDLRNVNGLALSDSECYGMVVRLRDDMEPYRGLYDCATKIIQEEGWGALYRGWWLTLLGNIPRYLQ